MSRKKKHAAHVNHERWLVSYADFITLLFAVFVVMYAASQVDNRKIGRLAQSIQVAFQDLGLFQASTARMPLDDNDPMPFSDPQMVDSVDRSASFGSISPNLASQPEADNGSANSLKEALHKALSQEILQKQVELREGPEGLVISLREVGFYAPGSDVLIQSSTGVLDKVAAVLKPTRYSLRIEGHTDNVPIHNARFDSNWELSVARSTGMIRLFVERYKFQPERLAAAGYGEYHPVASNATADGRSENRRVDFLILGALKPFHTERASPTKPATKAPLGVVTPSLPAASDLHLR